MCAAFQRFVHNVPHFEEDLERTTVASAEGRWDVMAGLQRAARGVVGRGDLGGYVEVVVVEGCNASMMPSARVHVSWLLFASWFALSS